ncbi:MAG: hypothetical protein J6A83_06410 [Clostridia bacterium]|nr:hypothetical protein [Clostridia bacterium]
MIISIVCIIVFIALIVSFAAYIWVDFYYTGNLEFYNFEEINTMYAQGDRTYFITATGYGYVFGDWSGSDYRYYRNAESKKLGDTQWAAPVKISDMKLSRIIPCKLGAFLITEHGELFCATDNQILKYPISNVVDVVFHEKSQQLLYVSADNTLYCLDCNNASYPLRNEISQIILCKNQIFYLDIYGNLFSGNWNSQDILIENEKLLYDNVSLFDVEDNGVFNAPFNFDTALLTVLTDNGDLYCKGLYHPSIGYQYLTDYPPTVKLEDWTLLGSNIVNFSTSAMGTVMLHKDGCVSYYGYDTTCDRWIGKKDFTIDDAVFVLSENGYICVKQKSGRWLFWGDSWRNQFCGVEKHTHSITSIEDGGTVLEVLP